MPSALRLSPGAKLVGKHGVTYKLLHPIVPRKGALCNVWSATVENDANRHNVIKQPDDTDGNAPGWPHFTREMQMQERFLCSSFIRRMVDVIPPSSNSEPPRMVLESFAKTLWDARNTRPLSTGEIRAVMKSILIGLARIHSHDLVYTDLKMQNVVVAGFDNETPGSGKGLLAKIADLGMRNISLISYRSPEVYFDKPWTCATDVWSWGMVYCHLLQAQVDFHSLGMFDNLSTGSLASKANAVRAAMAQEFELHSLDYYTSDPPSRELLPPKDETRQEEDIVNSKLHCNVNNIYSIIAANA